MNPKEIRAHALQRPANEDAWHAGDKPQLQYPRLDFLQRKSLVGCASEPEFDSDDRLHSTLIEVDVGSMPGTVPWTLFVTYNTDRLSF